MLVILLCVVKSLLPKRDTALIFLYDLHAICQPRQLLQTWELMLACVFHLNV